jgi:tRNA(His) 5'-end guanylyltransferase
MKIGKKELLNKSSNVQQEMIFQKGINWNDYPDGCKRGRIIIKEQYQKGDATRSRWISVEPPVFTQERDFLETLIP